MRLFLVVVVVGVAFSAACFLERLLRDYMRTDIQPNGDHRRTAGGRGGMSKRILVVEDQSDNRQII
jgi:hypothetical protein